MERRTSVTKEELRLKDAQEQIHLYTCSEPNPDAADRRLMSREARAADLGKGPELAGLPGKVVVTV